jgi:polysaccharide biosynthesis transport protein
MPRFSPTAAPAFSILDVLRGMFRRWFLISGLLALGVLGGMGVLTVNRPEFAGEARIMVAHQATPYDKANNVQELRLEQIDDRFVLSQVSVLQSEDLARRIVKLLELEGKGEFDSLANGIGKLKAVMLSLGFGTDPRLLTKEQRALQRLMKQLTVYQVPETNVIAVRYAASDGKTAADVANALVETYVLSTRENQSGPNSRARDWLAGQIQILRSKVSKSEAEVEKFRAEAGLLKGQTATLGMQEISELNSQITLAEASASEAAARADEIVAMLEVTGSVDASADVLGSQTIQQLRDRQVSATQKISELSATYLPNHPKMLAATRELSDVDRQIRREAMRIVDSLQGQAKVAQTRATSLRASLEKMKTREGGALQSDVRLKELERDALADRALLESLLARYADANARQDLSVQPGYAQVIQTASAPAIAHFPKPGPTMLLAIFAGLGMGLGLAFLLEIMAQASRLAAAEAGMHQSGQSLQHVPHAATRQDVHVPELPIEEPTPARQSEQVAEILRNAMAGAMAAAPPQIVASLPALPPIAKAFAHLEDVSAELALAEPVATIAGAIAQVGAKSGCKAFGVTSLGGTFDAPFATVALARMFSVNKMKTAILDMVPDRPSAMDLMEVPEGPGLCELVNGSADVAKVISRDSKTAVQLIRFGHGDSTSQAALAAKLPAMLALLTQVYDIILLNFGEANAATPELLQNLGAVLFLAPPHRQHDALAASRTLTQRGVRQSLFVRIEPQNHPASPLKQAI